MDQENKHPQKIDITIRDIIPSFSESAFIRMITGKNYKRVLNSVFPSTKERRVDLLLELEDNSILHIEFQTSNDKDMLYRMLEYYSLIKSHFKDRSLYQKLIYLGEDECNMENSFEDIGISYKYEIIDIKYIQCDSLIESNNIADITFAFLCNVKDREKLFKKAVAKLKELPSKERSDWFKKILTLLSIRPKLSKEIIDFYEEAPMLEISLTIDDIKEWPIVGKLVKELEQEAILKGMLEGELKGKLKGKLEGKIEGKLEGRLEEKLEDIKRVILTRFGILPEDIENRLSKIEDLEKLNVIFDKSITANSIDEIEKLISETTKR